ncbi:MULTISPECIES: hypothetical protein [Streptomyces]|uniref:Uncharacterized protein n=2 Tax=Streptomyces TaxID=1883 RepID=A0ABU4K246_9ACTN|nr:hypothetical protein [Streptomyces roseolus]MDX2291824.1 hypothetical protein [Streptomyces roseolus]
MAAMMMTPYRLNMETVMSNGVLRIESLRCIKPSEEISDEVVLKRDGRRVWPGGDDGMQMTSGTEAQIGHDILFGNSPEAVIVLFDQDDLGSDDNLGTVIVNENEAGIGLRTAEITTPGSRYTLTYRVGRIQF